VGQFDYDASLEGGVIVKKHVVILIACLAIVGGVFWARNAEGICEGGASDEACEGAGYQQHFRYTGKYPDDVGNTGFVDQSQGIAHDDYYWYITTSTNDNPNIWKIPVTQNLYGVGVGTPGVTMVRNDNVVCPTKDGDKNLGDLNYNHYGDLVAYKRKEDGKYYLLVPIENGTPGHAIAVFRAEDFACLGFDVVKLNNNPDPLKSDASAWCAVDKDGNVYTSPNNWGLFEWDWNPILLKYSLNWDTLGADPQNPVQLTFIGPIFLLKENGELLPPSEISGPGQGGEFSPDGTLLYVSGGVAGEYGGIHVFDTSNWRRIARSHSSGTFYYDIYQPWWCTWQYQEPEGLTVWDLERQRASYLDPDWAPYIQGQLHVLLLQNGVTGDSLYLYHYTNTTYVDYLYGDTADGTIGRPFKTVGEALAFYNQNEYFDHGHWTGGRIKIHTGSYNEALTFSRRIQLLSWSGKATVGSQGRFSLTPGGAININGGGVLKLY